MNLKLFFSIGYCGANVALCLLLWGHLPIILLNCIDTCLKM